MENFVYSNPTKIIFGKNNLKRIGHEAAKFGKKALVVYGMGSIKRNGVYDIVLKSLSENGLEFVEYEGVKPNPVLSHVKPGIEKFKKNSCDMIVAVGGGSVIDESKAISSGVFYNGDVWDFFTGKAKIEKAAPVIVALTIPATGSESNSGCVITKEETKQKYSAHSPHLFPKVSILDPSITFSIPKEQTAYGAVDIISHVLEGYFTTKDINSIITDNYVYAIVKSVILLTEKILENPEDYNARASFMWTATLALNGMQSLGYKNVEFVNHVIEHSLSAIFDIPHGLGLSIVLSGFLKRLMNRGGKLRIAEFGKNIFQLRGSIEEISKETVFKMEEWFRKIGLKTKLSENGILEKDFITVADNACELGKLWGWSYEKKDVIEILNFQK
ncbi:MAG: iron-containing alcohol dehydrogenase [Elusimicrobiota bacterium]